MASLNWAHWLMMIGDSFQITFHIYRKHGSYCYSENRTIQRNQNSNSESNDRNMYQQLHNPT